MRISLEAESLNVEKLEYELELKGRIEQLKKAKEVLEQHIAILEEERKVMAMTAKDFPPSVKRKGMVDVPDGIIAHLTRECGGNVHNYGFVEVTSSGLWMSGPGGAPECVDDLMDHSVFDSDFRGYDHDIPHTRNNWVC
jgi:hypothetical protein